MTIKTFMVYLLFMAASLAIFQIQATTITDHEVLVNQIGFLPKSSKIAIITDNKAQLFSVIDTQTGLPIYQGSLSSTKTWPLSNQSVKIAEFSAVEKQGHYRITTDNNKRSNEFSINDSVYEGTLSKTAKAYYLIRSGQTIETQYAGKYARKISHIDDKVYIHKSAASLKRPENSIISSSKGWFDAGDYNKYIVNSNITVFTLLAAIEDNGSVISKLNLNIPESADNKIDLVSEVLWNIDWMLTMQDPHDGGVYHKLTTKKFTPFGDMPDKQHQKRYVVAKSTTATLGYAAVMSYAYRVLAPYQNQLSTGYRKKLIDSAQAAWQWASVNPHKVYQQPDDIKTGQYSQPLTKIADEWTWAATELFLATENKAYLSRIQFLPKVAAPTWSNVYTLSLLSMAKSQTIPKQLKLTAIEQLTKTTNKWLEIHKKSTYKLALIDDDFVWGSNAQVLNKAFVLLTLNKIQPNQAYVEAAQSLLDYVLGRNPLGISYITGVGSRPVVNVHHRISVADGIEAPVPGLLSGGPYSGQKDKKDCAKAGFQYQSKLPALSFLEQTCSFASNEVAINWNAPLVYVLSAVPIATNTH